MSIAWARLGWVLAVFFAAITGVYVNKYAQALREGAIYRHEFESLQIRVEKQAEQNEQLVLSQQRLAEQLEAAQARLEALSRAVPPPATP